jgi:hypothetical protein
MMSISICINDRLYDQAKKTAKAEFRTIAHQVEYWAAVGRAALDNLDLPTEFIRDIIVARQEESEPFHFSANHY